MEEYLSALPEEWVKPIKISNDIRSVYHINDRKKIKSHSKYGSTCSNWEETVNVLS